MRGQIMKNVFAKTTVAAGAGRGGRRVVGRARPWVAAAALLVAGPAPGQDALHVLMQNQAGKEARFARTEGEPYTFKAEDFTLLATAMLEMDWNDNIGLQNNSALSDFVLRPQLQLKAAYPVSGHSVLSLNVGAGYSKYLEHEAYSAWYLGSGSELAFDIDVGQFTIDLHDQFHYYQATTGEGSVAGTANSQTGLYGNFENVAGFAASWDLNDVVLSLGYDHENYRSIVQLYEYLDHSSEMVNGRATFRVHPRLTVGTEAAAGWTAYDQTILPDNVNYSVGVFGDWRPNSAMRITPRAGYAEYVFEHGTGALSEPDQGAWYADLMASHQLTDKVTLGLSAGHELRLGIQAASVEDWYLRPNVAWRIFRQLTGMGDVFYEHGRQGLLSQFGGVTENYDSYGFGLGLNYTAVENLTVGLNYRLTLRSSDLGTRDYTQNFVGVLLTYTFK